MTPVGPILVNFDNIQTVSSPDSDSGRSNLPIGRVKPQQIGQNVNFDNIQAVSSPDSDSGWSNLPIGRVKPQKLAQNANFSICRLGRFLMSGTSFLIFVISNFGGYIDGFGQNGKRRIRD